MSTSGGTSGGSGVTFAKQTADTPWGNPGVYALTSTVPADGGWVDFGLVAGMGELTVGASGALDAYVDAGVDPDASNSYLDVFGDGGDANMFVRTNANWGGTKHAVVQANSGGASAPDAAGYASLVRTDVAAMLRARAVAAQTAPMIDLRTAADAVLFRVDPATGAITMLTRTLNLAGGADGDVLQKSGAAFAPAPLTQMLGGAAPVITAVNVAAGEADIPAIGGNTSADSTVSAAAATGVRLNRTSADGMTTRQLDVNNGGVRVTCNNSDVLDVDENGVVSQVSFQAQGLMGVFGATPISQPAPIADAAGGVVIDAEARTALNALLAAVRLLGLIDT